MSSTRFPLALRSAALLLVVALSACLARPAVAGGEMPARARVAYQALLRGEVQRARRESALAVREAKLSAAAWSVRGFILSHGGDKPGAEQAYREAIRLDPADPVARNNLGAVLLARGEARGARRAFEAALSLHPFYADARNNLGAALERLGEAEAARRNYRLATVIDPRHAKAYNNLGAAQLRAGQVRSASASFARAAALDPDVGAPANNHDEIDQGAGRSADFLARMEAAAARPGASAALKARVLSLRAGREAAARRWRQARALYLEALRLVPRDTALLNNVAVVEDQLRMDREALLHLTEALDIDPGLKVAQNNVGIVHVHRGRLDLAESIFKALIREDPSFHRAHYNLGVIHASRGDLAKARASFTRAARLAPRDAAVRYNLAILAQGEQGDARTERRAYEDVLRLDPDLVEAHLALGMLLADPATPARVRDPALAARHLRRFLALAPSGDAEGRQQATDWLGWLAAQK